MSVPRLAASNLARRLQLTLDFILYINHHPSTANHHSVTKHRHSRAVVQFSTLSRKGGSGGRYRDFCEDLKVDHHATRSRVRQRCRNL